MVKSFAFLVATAEAATCTGTKDLVVSEPQCYHGSGGALGLKEDVDVKIDDFGANGAGHMEVTGGGIAAFTCSNKAFTKSGLKITTDLSDCQPDGIKIPEIDFCSDQDAVKVTVKADAVPLPITATLSRVPCSGRGFTASCSGTNDPVVTAPQCYHGSGGALGLKEDVDVKIDDFGANGAGHMEVTGGGIAAFTCSNKAFTKSGFKITTDLSDCQPDGIRIPEIDFCSDQDAVKVTVKADGVPLPVTATLSRVACSGRGFTASCSGTKDLVVTAPQCYHGSGGALGLKEDVGVKIDYFGANGAGHMEVTGGGIASFTCSNKAFTKSGLKITTDLNDCQPDGIKIPEIDFCSDQDAVKVTVKADAVPLPVTATLTRVPCPALDITV